MFLRLQLYSLSSTTGLHGLNVDIANILLTFSELAFAWSEVYVKLWTPAEQEIKSITCLNESNDGDGGHLPSNAMAISSSDTTPGHNYT